MSTSCEKTMDIYPWAAPTEEQKRMFDALSYDEQLKMVQEAISQGMQTRADDRVVDGKKFIAELRRNQK